MLPVFLAIMAIYVLLLIFVLHGRWSSLKFASIFKRALLILNAPGLKEREDNNYSKPAVTHGYLHSSTIFTKSKSGRSAMRQSSIQLYSDNGYFTSLTVEKKESVLRTQEDIGYLAREKSELKARIQRLKSQNCHGINLELVDEVYHRKRDLKYSTIESYIAHRNTNSGSSSSSKHPTGSRQLGTSPKRSSEVCLPGLPLKGSTSPKKLRLSRGIWANSRRRTLINKAGRQDLSIIPERDESEERASTNVSSTHFKCQADDSRMEIESSAVC